MQRANEIQQAGASHRLRVGPVLLLVAAVSSIIVGAIGYRWGPAWYYRLVFTGPQGIVVHHSATAAVVRGRRVDGDFLDEVHAVQGWGLRFGDHTYHIGYHYVILPDGTVQPGRPEWMPGAHASGHNNYLGICLVGDFSKHNGRCAYPPAAQRRVLVKLIRSLMDKYHLKVEDVYRHSDLGATRCPGAGVPWERIIRELRTGDRTERQQDSRRVAQVFNLHTLVWRG